MRCDQISFVYEQHRLSDSERAVASDYLDSTGLYRTGSWNNRVL